MSETLDAKTMDLVGVLSGRDYPELEISVYLDETLGFSIKQLSDMLRSLEVLGKSEEAEKVHKELEGLVEKYREEAYVVKLKGVPEKVYRDILSTVQKQFPDDTDLMGRPKPNPEGDAAFTKLVWQAYIQTVTGPSGGVSTVGEAEVQALQDMAPPTAQDQITAAIRELRTGAKAGFEHAAKEVDFLSRA